MNIIGGGQLWRYDLASGSFDFDRHGPLPTAEVRLGDESFVGGDGLFISTNLNQPPKIISTLPDDRPLAPVRALVEVDEQVVVVLPREVWSVQRKPAAAVAETK